MNTSFNENSPFVSVVVPVDIGANFVAKNIESLLAQDYPKEKYEIIIIENASDDGTGKIISKYPVIHLEENSTRNSYLARNKGIQIARGEILAFTDIDCVVSPNWISSGVAGVLRSNSDILGGVIEFTFREGYTSADLLDSIVNLNNEAFIRLRHSAQTANVFIPKKLFDKLGLFPTQERSGGDALWTNRAWREGYSINFDPNVAVFHPARGLKELLEKHIRVGTGAVAVWRGRGQNMVWIVGRFISFLLPVLAFRLPRLIKQRGRKDIKYPLFRMMLVSYVCTLFSAYGIIKSVFKK